MESFLNVSNRAQWPHDLNYPEITIRSSRSPVIEAMDVQS